MSRGPTPRQLAREHNIARIKGLALTQLAESGAATLSLRAIARELNLVSSAIYRYYASRDELITALIVDAYADLATRLEEAAAADRRGPRRRLVDSCRWTSCTVRPAARRTPPGSGCAGSAGPRCSCRSWPP